MANIKYVVSTKRVNKQGKAIIFLRYLHACKATYISTKRKIEPAFWSSQNQKIKNGYSGFNAFNTYLEKFRQRLEDIIHEALSQEKDPSVEYVKERFRQKEHAKVNPVQYMDFISFAEQFIDRSAVNKAKATILGYKGALRNFKEFEKYSGEQLTWSSFDQVLYEKLKRFLFVEKNYCNNSVGKIITILKTLLNEAIARDYPVNLSFKNQRYKSISEEVDNIYLNENEINNIKCLDLSNNPRLERVRSLFLAAAHLGLRYSDFSQIKPENIKENFIQIRTQKTNTNVVIPLHPYVKAVMEKYKDKYPNSLPPAYSNQKMNQYLKDIGRLAGLNEDIIVTRTKGGKRVATTHKKYELLTTHCARRSFATNLFKQGFPAINIMKITGHQTEAAFKKYIKINQEEAATMLQNHWQAYYSDPSKLSPILKIA